MLTEQSLVELQDSTAEPIVAIHLPITMVHDTLAELFFTQCQLEDELFRIKSIIDTVETQLIELDLPLSKQDYEQRIHPENNTYKDLAVPTEQSLLFSTPEND